MKGKLTLGPKIKKTNPIEVNGSDDSSGLSSISNDSQGKRLNGSDEEDEEDDEEYNVVQMTDKEVRRMFDNEVSCFVLQFVCNIDICPSCPRLQITMQLCCLTMITTLKSLLPSLITAGKGPARKPRDPPHPNLKGCLMMYAILVKRKLMRMTPSLCTFPWLLEVLSHRSLAR